MTKSDRERDLDRQLDEETARARRTTARCRALSSAEARDLCRVTSAAARDLGAVLAKGARIRAQIKRRLA